MAFIGRLVLRDHGYAGELTKVSSQGLDADFRQKLMQLSVALRALGALGSSQLKDLAVTAGQWPIDLFDRQVLELQWPVFVELGQAIEAIPLPVQFGLKLPLP